MRRCVCRASLVNSALWTLGRGSGYSPAVCRPRDPALRHSALGISLERFLERHPFAADRRRNRNCPGSDLPRIFKWSFRTSHQRCGFPGDLRDSMVAAPPPSQGQPRLVRRKYVQAIAEDRDRLVVVVLTPIGACHATVMSALAATR